MFRVGKSDMGFRTLEATLCLHADLQSFPGLRIRSTIHDDHELIAPLIRPRECQLNSGSSPLTESPVILAITERYMIIIYQNDPVIRNRYENLCDPMNEMDKSDAQPLHGFA